MVLQRTLSWARLSASGRGRRSASQSSVTLSNHLFFGLPLRRLPCMCPWNNMCGYLWLSIRTTWPKYDRRRVLTTSTMSSSSARSFIMSVLHNSIFPSLHILLEMCRSRIKTLQIEEKSGHFGPSTIPTKHCSTDDAAYGLNMRKCLVAEVSSSRCGATCYGLWGLFMACCNIWNLNLTIGISCIQ